MPEVDGVAAPRELRSRVGKPQPRVVIVSSQDDENAIEETVRLGASVYLTKPITTQTVHKVLSQIVLRATLSGVH